MYELTQDQSEFKNIFTDFMIDKVKTDLALIGGAGTGKTYLGTDIVAWLIEHSDRRIIFSAPTHKACRVIKYKLDAAGIKWQFKPRKTQIKEGHVIIDTTAALLGVRMEIDENQTADQEHFKKVGSGSLDDYLGYSFSQSTMPLLIIDEVSMLAQDDFFGLRDYVKGRAKILCIGDDGQLPPVKKKSIDFKKDFGQAYELKSIVRQAADSAIIKLAWSVRDHDVKLTDELLVGSGIEKTDNIIEAFLDNLEMPVDDETERSVFISYTNATVDAIQDKACMKLYGHDRKHFKVGQLVLASRAVDKWNAKYRRVEKIAVQDQLRVVGFSRKEDPMYGHEVMLKCVDDGDRIQKCFYLSGDKIEDKNHPFNKEHRRLQGIAEEYQRYYKELKPTLSNSKKDKELLASVNAKRSSLWRAMFDHDNTVIYFQHPFSLTSHKVQGSTYKKAYVLISDLLRYNRKSAYVAITRPSQTLVIPTIDGDIKQIVFKDKEDKYKVQMDMFGKP